MVEKFTIPEEHRKIYRLTVPIDELIEGSCRKFEHSCMICKHMLRYQDKNKKP